MLAKQVVWGVWSSLFALIPFLAPASRADTIKGSGTATFQIWDASEINDNGKPFWDNKSLSLNGKKQKKKKNVGFYLTDALSAPLDDAPGDLPYWGTAGKAKKKNGGNADLNFFFEREELTNSAVLKLEVDSASNLDEFGWYDVADPSVLHPIFLGSDSPDTNDTFAPSAQYGFYLKRGSYPIFYTESSLNPVKDTRHQHFAVFQESATPGEEVYWIGVENRTRKELKKKEGGLGDYNDMLIRISAAPPPLPVPEPSTSVLVLSSALLVVWIRKRRR
jgi:hypothetical protein